MNKYSKICLGSVFAFWAATYLEFPSLDLYSLISYDETEILNHDPVLQRGLTIGEQRLVRSVFGDSLEADKISLSVYQKYHEIKKLESPVIASNVITIYGQNNYLDDFSKADKTEGYSNFIFGLTRLWQNQNHAKFSPNADLGTDYILSYKVRFGDLGPYQQAAAVSDYASWFLHHKHDYIYAKERYGAGNCDANKFWTHLIDPVLPALKYTRVSKEKQTQRGLTPSEKDFLNQFFDYAIDVDNVVQEMNPIECADRAAHVDSKYKVTYFGNTHAADYTKTDGIKAGYFIHELTHIWQRHTAYRYTNELFVNEPDKYAYPINNKKFKFVNYAVEQQGAILEDYARVFFFDTSVRHDVDEEGLRILVESHFPHLSEFRMRYNQEKSKSKQSGAVVEWTQRFGLPQI